MEAKLAYLAGIFDGEGCFSAPPTHEHRYARIRVAQRRPEVISWIYENFGGHVNERVQKDKPIYVWDGRPVWIREWLPLVIPFLVLKPDQALLCVEIANVPWRERENLWLRLKGLR